MSYRGYYISLLCGSMTTMALMTFYTNSIWESSKRSNLNVKTILFYNGMPEEAKNTQLGIFSCSKSNYCYMTDNRFELPFLSDFHAIIFDPKNMKCFFNWTYTYRLDSDLPLFYGRFYLNNISCDRPWKPSEHTPWMAYDKEKFKLSLRTKDAEFISLAQRPNKAAFILSTCNHTASERMRYIQKLKEYFPVEGFGACGEKSCTGGDLDEGREKDYCSSQIRKKYKFVLAFENSLCEDYVSDVFFRNAKIKTISSFFKMESLLHSVRKISSDTLHTIEEASTDQEKPDKTWTDRDQVQAWKGHIHSAIQFWEQWHCRYLAANQKDFRNLMYREFGNSLWTVVSNFLNKGVYDLCPYAEITVTDKSLNKDWERLNLKLFQKVNYHPEVTEEAVWKLCTAGDTEVMPNKVILETDKDDFRIQIWKRKPHNRNLSLLGTCEIRIPLNSDTIRVPIHNDQGQDTGNWLKVKIKLHHMGRETASKILPKLVANHLKAVYHTRLEEDSEEQPRAEKLLLRALVSKTGNGNTTLKHNGREVTFPEGKSELTLEIQDLMNDVFEFSTPSVTPPQSAPGSTTTTPRKKRTSSIGSTLNNLFMTPQKAKRRSTEALFETLISSISAEEAVNSVASSTAGELQVVSLATYPWCSTGLHLLFPGGDEWSLRVRLEPQAHFDAAFHYRRLYALQLTEIKGEEQRMEWDGGLDQDLSAISGALRLLSAESDDAHPEEVSIMEILALREHFLFSHEVSFNALCRLIQVADKEVKEAKSEQLRTLGQVCLGTFLGTDQGSYPAVFRSRKARKYQIHYAVSMLNVLFSTSDSELQKKLQESCLSRLKSYSKKFSPRRFLTYLVSHVEPALEALQNQQASSRPCHTSWSLMLSQVVLTVILEAISMIQPDTSQEETFTIYILLLKHIPEEVTDRAKLFPAFEPFLEAWAQFAIHSAGEQVNRVIAFEREKHGQSLSYWQNWTEESNVEWLEASRHINKIFSSCHETWAQMKWPVASESLLFAIRMFKGMHNVFKKYVDDFLQIILQDDIFNRYECVIILKNVLQSMDYLKTTLRMVNNFVHELQEEERTADLQAAAQEFSCIFEQACLEADDTAENIVLQFVQSQRSQFKSYLVKDKIISEELLDPVDEAEQHEDDQQTATEDYLLSYVNRLLYFLHEHLDTPDEDKHKFQRMLDSHLNQLMVELISEHYDSLKQETSGKPEPFQQLAMAVPELIGFRRNLSLEPSTALAEISKDLYPRSSPTPELISEQICLAKACGDSQGQVIFRVGYLESSEQLHVQVQEVCNLRPRDGEQFCNFSLTLAILPLRKEPFLLTQRTQPYKKMNELNFEHDTGEDSSGRFVFNLPSKGYDVQECYLQIDLYHQIPYTYNKRFSGKVSLPLHQVNLIMKEDDLKYVSLISKSLRKFQHVRSPEYEELTARKNDPLALAFLERYDKQRKEAIRFDGRSWAKVNESQYSSELMAKHFFELINNDNDRDEQGELMAELEVQLAWHSTREEVILKIWNLARVRHRIDEDHANPSLVIRIEPTKCRSKSSKIYPSSREVDLHTQQDGEFSFKLGKINYNYHVTFVRILLFDNVRSKIPGVKPRRYFLGHVLLPLSDLHPIDDRLLFKSVGSRTLFLRHLHLSPDSSVWQELSSRKDNLAKKYVEETRDFVDREALKYPHSKEDWVDPIPEAPANLISRHLDMLRVSLYDSIERKLGVLKCRIGLLDSKYNAHMSLQVRLKSIHEVVPITEGENSMNCNFSLEMNVLPHVELTNPLRPAVSNASDIEMHKPQPVPTSDPWLRERTLVYTKRTSLLFDYLNDEDQIPGRKGDTHKINFDFPVARNPTSPQFLVLDLFLHRTTWKTHRGTIIVALDNLNRCKATEELQEMESIFRYPVDGLSSSAEYLELESRNEAEARKYIEFLDRRACQGSKRIQTLFSMHEWAKL